MTITFIPENRRQKYLLIALGIVLLGGIGLVWYQFFWEDSLVLFEKQPPPPRPANIDLSVFEHPAFLELGEPRPPIPFPEEFGKRNIFIPQ